MTVRGEKPYIKKRKQMNNEQNGHAKNQSNYKIEKGEGKLVSTSTTQRRYWVEVWFGVMQPSPALICYRFWDKKFEAPIFCGTLPFRPNKRVSRCAESVPYVCQHRQFSFAQINRKINAGLLVWREKLSKMEAGIIGKKIPHRLGWRVVINTRRSQSNFR